MNIAHAIYGLGLGGAQKVVASIIRGRSSEDFRYFVYTFIDGVQRQDVELAGASVRVLPQRLPKFDPTLVRRLSTTLKQDQIHVLHAHLFGDSLHGYFATRQKPSLPLILTLHIGPDGWNRLQKVAYPQLVARSRFTVACSESVEQAVQEKYPKTSDKLQTIPNGIEIPEPQELHVVQRQELRQQLGAGPGDVLLAAIGRLSEQKGFRYLISALARLSRDDSGHRGRLAFLGEGELLAPLRAQATAEGVEDRIVFAGFRNDVGRLLQVIDGVVFSSLYEGLPIALLEAMAAGLPIVSTAIPGNLDALRDDQEALIVPTADSEQLALALGRVVREPALRHRLGQSGRRRFLDRFTAQAMVARYEALYLQAAEGAVTRG